jgi:hypothetical protein
VQIAIFYLFNLHFKEAVPKNFYKLKRPISSKLELNGAKGFLSRYFKAQAHRTMHFLPANPLVRGFFTV